MQRRKQEAKKWEIQEKRKRKKTEKAARKKRNAGARDNGTSCKVCWQEYSPSDDKNLPWVMSDQCELWMHIDCIPVGVDQTPIDS